MSDPGTSHVPVTGGPARAAVRRTTPDGGGPEGSGTRPPARRSGWELVQLFTPLAQTLITVVVGGVLAWLLTGRITTAIQQRQLELSHVQAMREIYLRLQTVDSTAAQAHADAHALAMFRDYAVVPFVMLLQRTDPAFLREAALAGLRGVALTDSALVARQMLRIVTNESGLYHWRAHLAAIQLLGELRCRPAAGPLEALRAEIGAANVDTAMAALQGRVSTDSHLLDNDVVRVQEALAEALAAIRRREGH